ncbi:uncharacterized protein LOC127656829 [Xyrauchen texanus]|uniref:uncharacterized protein LOC127656829 n=1 Tax=Xyrauchen texanus TaxID=154827 RepID=UPI0022422754|nr:uncharacterized protein LOC127656829 [Xyrauchen texanus]
MPSKGKRMWTVHMEERLIALWSHYAYLYDISDMLYHDRPLKEKKWLEIAAELNIPVEDVKQRAGSLRTQYSRLLKPRPSGSGGKPLTSKQRWLLDNLEFLRRHYTPMLSKSSLNLTPEQPDVGQKPSDVDVCQEFAYEVGSFSDTSENIPDSKSVPRQTTPHRKPHQGKKRTVSNLDTEVEAIAVFREMSATVMAGFNQGNDLEATFAQQIASDLREIQSPALRKMAKRQIQMLVYEYQDKDQLERRETS